MVWFVRWVIKMRQKFGTCWVECRDPVDLMVRPSNMEIDLCLY